MIAAAAQPPQNFVSGPGHPVGLAACRKFATKKNCAAGAVGAAQEAQACRALDNACV